MNIKQDILRRANYAFVFLLVVAGVIFWRLIHVQYFGMHKGKRWSERIEGVAIKRDTLRAKRGSIYDAGGNLLATSLPTYEVGIDPRVAKDNYFNEKVDSLGLLLSGLFNDRSARQYTRLIRTARAKKRKYVLLNRRRITFAERQQMLKWPFFRSTPRVSARGGAFRTYYERYHPFANMALRTIGDLDAKHGKGLMGLEASFQPQLAGKDAVGRVEVLSGGVRKPLDNGPDQRPEPGYDLYTTIDVNFQDIAETALRNALERYQAQKGCVIVMEVATGEIRALANLTRRGNHYVENFNHALAGRTDPGSTFKLASMMALLEEKAISLDQLVHTGGGAVRWRGVTIADAKRGGSGTLTARQVFEKSSNVGTHLLMKSYFYSRPDLYCQYLRQFRLSKPTGIHMKGEAPPVMRNPDSKGWSKTSITFMSYGYEMQLTPLQMLAFYNAVANNGHWVRPMLVKQIRLGGNVVENFAPDVSPEPICTQRTARLARELLEGVVERGTARNIKSPYYKIAGKTGTAQKIVNGQYQVGRYFTSFIGYFPADKPKYSVITVVDSPQGNNIDLLYAGSVAAPVFKEVADKIHAYDIRMHAPIPTLSRQPNADGPLIAAAHATDLHTLAPALKIDSPLTNGWVRNVANTAGQPRWRTLPTRPDRVPDVRGLTLRDALHLLENRGLRVVVSNATTLGRVTEQSLEPGAPITERCITLTLAQPTPKSTSAGPGATLGNVVAGRHH